METNNAIKVGDKVTRGNGLTVWTVLQLGIANNAQITSGKKTTMSQLSKLKPVL